MLWPAALLMVLAIAAVFSGLRITNGPGSGDERASGAIFVVAGIFFGVLAAVWWVIAVTVKAFA